MCVRLWHSCGFLLIMPHPPFRLVLGAPPETPQCFCKRCFGALGLRRRRHPQWGNRENAQLEWLLAQFSLNQIFKEKKV